MITLLPLGLIAALSILFFLLPEQSNTVLAKVRFFLGDTFGVYYLAIGLGVFLLSLYLAFSKYGDIVLGVQIPPADQSVVRRCRPSVFP